MAYTTFNKLLHLSRSDILQSIHNGQRNYPYEVSYYAHIFKMCVYLINVAKCKFDPNETIIMYDLSSSLQSFLVDCNTGVKPCTYPLRSKQENLFCKFNKVIITISLNFVDFGKIRELLVRKVLHTCCSHLSLF